MSIIKDGYKTIQESVFQLSDINTLFESYLDEFFPGQTTTITQFIEMFLNILRDFFQAKIDEKTLSLLVHKSLYSEKTKKYHYKPYLFPYNDILSLIHEVHDINWSRESPHYQTYLEELRKKWKRLVVKYSKQKS
ncbi:MAG: hypothetical protein COY81_01245 [Candidatus Pacebacteria bacterium CG_4_10_14_0_8_um_filter_43_12]|nr:MAG: hypothetical protein COY81_01245 [Candidatus Pacebacteria bacterium CG_4_10_14_0_8_um_filter_43_12]